MTDRNRAPGCNESSGISSASTIQIVRRRNIGPSLGLWRNWALESKNYRPPLPIGAKGGCSPRQSSKSSTVLNERPARWQSGNMPDLCIGKSLMQQKCNLSYPFRYRAIRDVDGLNKRRRNRIMKLEINVPVSGLDLASLLDGEQGLFLCQNIRSAVVRQIR